MKRLWRWSNRILAVGMLFFAGNDCAQYSVPPAYPRWFAVILCESVVFLAAWTFADWIGGKDDRD